MPSTASVAPTSSVARCKPPALFRLVQHRGRLMPPLHFSVQQLWLLLQVLLQFCRSGSLPIVAYAFPGLHLATLTIVPIFFSLPSLFLLISLQYTPRNYFSCHHFRCAVTPAKQYTMPLLCEARPVTLRFTDAFIINYFSQCSATQFRSLLCLLMEEFYVQRLLFVSRPKGWSIAGPRFRSM